MDKVLNKTSTVNVVIHPVPFVACATFSTLSDLKKSINLNHKKCENTCTFVMHVRQQNRTTIDMAC